MFLSRVLISGYYGFGNTGDEAILQAMVTEIKRNNSETSICVLSNNPVDTSKTYDVEGIDRTDIFKILKAISKCDYVISGGGSLFQDVTSFGVPWYYGFIFIVAFLFRKPVKVYAQGIGPVNSKINRLFLKFLMNNSSFISVRDERSHQELIKMGVRKEIECTVDPAFLINPADKESLKAILEKENGAPLSDKPKLAFAIRRWKGIDISNEIALAADRAYDEMGIEIVFVSLYLKEDLQLAEDIVSKMKNPAIIIRGNYSPSVITGIFGMMDLNVCVRFLYLSFLGRISRNLQNDRYIWLYLYL